MDIKRSRCLGAAWLLAGAVSWAGAQQGAASSVSVSQAADSSQERCLRFRERLKAAREEFRGRQADARRAFNESMRGKGSDERQALRTRFRAQQKAERADFNRQQKEQRRAWRGGACGGMSHLLNSAGAQR